jgi:hypothetical protein
MTSNTGAFVGPRPGWQSWEPVFSKREALRCEYTEEQYEHATSVAERVVEEHMRAGTSRERWEPSLAHIKQVQAPYQAAAEHIRDELVATSLVPMVESSQSARELASALVEAVAAYPSQIRFIEQGPTLSGAKAGDHARRLGSTVDRETRDGAGHHHPVGRWWRAIAPWTPVGEALASAGFLAWSIDAPWTEPWQDPAGLMLILIVIALIVGLQPKLLGNAASAHNQAREVEYDGNHEAAARLYRTRNKSLALAAVVATVITGGMVYRALAALAEHTVVIVTLMIGYAVVTGLGMPVLAYVVKAFHSSRKARQYVQADLDLTADANAQRGHQGEAIARLEHIRDNHQVATEQVAPRICAAVTGQLEQARKVYDLLRAQIGGLPAISADGHRELAELADGRRVASIHSGLPGTSGVDMTVMTDQLAALAQLRASADELRERLDQVPGHPWAI